MEDSLPEPATEPKPDAASQQDQSKEKPERGPLKVAIVSQVAPPPSANNVPQNGNTDKTPLWKKILEFSALVVAVVVAVIYGGQLLVMKGQLHQMLGSSGQTDKIIIADQRIATAMENSFSVAQASYAATVEQAEISQRARVSGMVSPVGRIEAGKPILFRILITNTGRTPALGVSFVTKKASVTIRQSPSLDIGPPVFKSGDMHSQGQIQPNQPVISDLEYTFSQPDVNLINSQKARIYIAGKIAYDDVYGVHHWTTFCEYYLTGGLFATYSKYNGVDKNQPKVILPKPN